MLQWYQANNERIGMTIQVKYIKSEHFGGTDDGVTYVFNPIGFMAVNDWTEKH